MKKYIFVLALLVFGCSDLRAQKIGTLNSIAKTSRGKVSEREKFDPKRVAADDLKNAIKKATAENKRIILDVGGEWCGWCRLMDNFLIKNAELGKLRDENYVWVKINMSPENENKEFLAAYPEITGYPHLFVLEKDGKFLHSQDTAPLEEKEGYNLQKFTEFFIKWQPSKSITK